MGANGPRNFLRKGNPVNNPAYAMRVISHSIPTDDLTQRLRLDIEKEGGGGGEGTTTV